MLGVEQHNGPVAFAIEGIGHGQYIRGTRLAAKFTPFAALDVDYNSTFCHCEKLLFKKVASDGKRMAGKNAHLATCHSLVGWDC